MPHAHLMPIKTAAAVFPLLALVLLLPTAVVLYRRHGVMSQGRTLSLYAFLYYALTAVCLTVVPLPRRTADMCTRFSAFARPQWTPGNTVADIWKEAHHKVTPGALVLQNPAVAGALLNLLLLVPLGVFLRYHVRCGPRATVAVGLASSLFFELTQWSGVWGLYDCPYRLFDVDDLLTNTAGAAAGWLLAGPLTRVLPALETLDGRALAIRPVPFGRRLVALIVDLAGFLVVSGVAGEMLAYGDPGGEPWVPAGVFVLWFVVLPLRTGATPGKRLLLLRLEAADGGPLTPGALAVRAALLGTAALPLLAGMAVASAVLMAASSLPGPTQLTDLLGAVHQSVGTEAVTLAAVAIAPSEVLIALAAFFLALRYGLRTLRHPAGLAPHERVSGVRTTALPHTRAVGAVGTAGTRSSRLTADATGVPSSRPAAGAAGAPSPHPVRQARSDASSTTVTSGGAPTRTGGPQAPAPRVT
ncbi:VanZ family protein [Streptomyces sp. NA02950]|uniref:VanZ family protein n=1 Tax=Streptomyces sp. NA02950 TaxID=2742137 RepID=UPI0015904427|nr:VanZ family protein [Streptomyces sp. NA02950]QKV94452.1 VanZ family protein [Streptomyces sp. NA02950]